MGSWPWKNEALLEISRWQTRDTKQTLLFNKHNNKKKKTDFFLFLQNDPFKCNERKIVLRQFAVVSSNFHICSWFPSDFLILVICSLTTLAEKFSDGIQQIIFLFFVRRKHFCFSFRFTEQSWRIEQHKKNTLGGWMDGNYVTWLFIRWRKLTSNNRSEIKQWKLLKAWRKAKIDANDKYGIVRAQGPPKTKLYVFFMHKKKVFFFKLIVRKSLYPKTWELDR